MKSTGNFLGDESYCELIEMCIKRHDKFGAGTFFANLEIAEHVGEHPFNYEVSKRGIEVFPPDMDKRFLDDIFNFAIDDDDDGTDDE